MRDFSIEDIFKDVRKPLECIDFLLSAHGKEGIDAEFTIEACMLHAFRVS